MGLRTTAKNSEVKVDDQFQDKEDLMTDQLAFTSVCCMFQIKIEHTESQHKKSI